MTDFRDRLAPNTSRRISDRVYVADSGCWIWQGRLDRHGYGLINVRLDGKWTTMTAHRLNYRLAKGDVPNGLTLDHLCRVRHCVNPDHMEPVSSRENTLRGTTGPAVNAVKTHCIHGHPLSGTNVYIDPSGYRQCRSCRRNRDRAKHGQRPERWKVA